MDLGGNAGAYIKSALLGAGAWIVLGVLPASAATPDQLYRTWQKNSRDQPEIAEKAAADYLHAAPSGPHARTLHIWLDAYRKTLASLLSRIPQSARQAPANSKQASAQPFPSSRLPAAHTPSSPLTPPPPNPPPSSPPPSRQAASPPPPPPSPPPSRQVAASPPLPPQSRQPAAPSPPRAPETRLASAPNPPLPKAPQAAASRPAVPRETRQSVPPENNPSKKQPLSASRDSLAEAEGQSLPEALAFIADKVGSENGFDFVARFRDPAAGREIVEHLSYKASNVTIDPNRCRVSFRWHVEQDYRGMPDQDRTVELRLAKSIAVKTISQALTELNSAEGHPFSVSAQPQAYAVHIARWDSPSGDNLYFRDSRTAARVGEVARHAMELCDDRDRQAFRGR